MCHSASAKVEPGAHLFRRVCTISRLNMACRPFTTFSPYRSFTCALRSCVAQR